jgi:N-acetylneuraminate 9-O-acetyltransferase
MAFLEKKNHFLFIGDVRVKQLFESFIAHFQLLKDDKGITENEYIDDKLKLRVNFVEAGDLKTMLAELERLQKEDVDHPNFIIASSKFHKSPNYTKELEKALTRNLSLLVAPIEYLTSRKQTKVLWKLQDPIDETSSLLSSEWKDVTNSDIDHFNQIVSDTLKYSSNLNIWRSGTQVAYGLLVS